MSIQPAVGELLMPQTMSEQDFCKEQGRQQAADNDADTVTVTLAVTFSQYVSWNKDLFIICGSLFEVKV